MVRHLASLALLAVTAACGSRTGGLVDPGPGTADDASAASTSAPDAPPPSFATGTYACESSLSASGTWNGTRFESAFGGRGTLVVTQSGAEVVAAYSGDSFLGGTLAFTVTTATSAELSRAEETLTVQCFSGFGTPGDQPLTVTSSSLTLDGPALFLSLWGTAQPGDAGQSPCDGVTVPGALACTLASASGNDG